MDKELHALHLEIEGNRVIFTADTEDNARLFAALLIKAFSAMGNLLVVENEDHPS